MLPTTFGLSKEYLQFLDKENSTQNEGEDTYTLIFISGEKEVFKKVGIKKAVMNFIELHRESLENALNQAERLQANTDEVEEKESKQDESNQASSIENTEIAVFNNIPVARLQKFFTLENIGILEKLIENEKSGVLLDHSTIPDHYRKLSNNKSVSIRMNEEIYNKMKLHSIEIGESIATITNFIFDMYLKEMKK
ncbi:hypothetical protein [Fusobacterium hwasookii]|uniref:Uncharacterized protein n=1 Tax=Fusobacterium hwasookii ChDC F128 TaxID=1216362 RepID=A0ABN0GXR6_9FUSO|nr:hypothetical protein [Fusobacterium hwasookii]EJU06727.1 hypothetical protein B437_10947 [Fusobacterium hwasookii ChDC F128]QNE67349.1 hypothetical protein H5V36_11215 [Fusobacterium hwasookii]